MALLVIAAATVLVYSNTFDAPFHFDDFPNIVENARLRNLVDMWPPSGGRYLGYLSFSLNYQLAGLRVFGFHATNLLIHLCNGALVFWLTSLTLRTPSVQAMEASPLIRRYLPLTAALLFALHPVQTQAVTFIVQRFTSLATLFYLLSVALFVRARLQPPRGPSPRVASVCLYCAAIAAAAAAMSTKEIAFTLPLVVGAYELLFFGSRRRLVLLAPLAGTALLILLGLILGDRSLGEALDDVTHAPGEAPIPRPAYIVTQLRVVLTYVRLLVFPAWQNLDYDFSLSRSLAEPSVVFALLVLLAIAGASVALLVRHRKTNRAEGVLIFWGVTWFFVTLSIESSVIPIRDVIFEHRMYLPLAGAAVALGAALLWGLARLRPLMSPVGMTLALAATAGPLGAATYVRNAVWTDPVTLWSDVAAKSPGKTRARYNLGRAYVEKGRYEDAIGEFREAIRIDPRFGEAHHNLGSALAERGQLEESVREYQAALGLWSSSSAEGLDRHVAETRRSLGLVLERQGQLEAAIREYREAIRLDHSSAQARHDLGVALAALGTLDEAIGELAEAIRLQPHFPKAHENLCSVYGMKNRLDDALRECSDALRQDPVAPGAYENLAQVLIAQGRASEAIRPLRRAFELNPAPENLVNLAGALESAGDPSAAMAEYQRFLELAVGQRVDPALVERVRSRMAVLRSNR